MCLLSPLLLFAMAVSLFAITTTVTINDKILFSIHIPNGIQKIFDVFRASARYFWVAYYLLMIFTVIATVRLIKRTVIASIILAVVFAIQLYDYKALLHTEYIAEYTPYHPPLSEKQWRPLFQKMNKFIFYPPYEVDYLTPTDYRYLFLLRG